MVEILVEPEGADQTDVKTLMQLSNDEAARLYPDARRTFYAAQALNPNEVTVLVARTADGKAVGSCCIFKKPDNTVELKRMIVDPRFRGLGVAKALVASAQQFAKAQQFKAIQLEVGVRNLAAQSVYSGAGFRERAHFAPHKASEQSHFMEWAVD